MLTMRTKLKTCIVPASLIMAGLGLAVGSAPVAARRVAGLPPGTWDVTWLEPRLAPASHAHVTSFTRCYEAADAVRGSNPVMPPAQVSSCERTEVSGIGGDLVYDTTCGLTDHRLRLFVCGEGFCGTYRWVGRKGNKQAGIYEAIVILRPGKGRCEPT